MKSVTSHSLLFFVLFLVVGGILGGIIGEILSASSFGAMLPMLTRHYEIMDIQNVRFNLYIMDIQLGLHFAPNLLSIIGIDLAGLICKRL